LYTYAERSYDTMKIGDREWVRRTITDADIANFAGVSGDFNPLHTDEEYAKTTIFGKRIAHGFFTGMLVTYLIGNKLPGAGYVYMKQDLKFLKPVFSGDTLTAQVEVVEKIDEKKRVLLRTFCLNQKGELVLDGEAMLTPLKK